MSLLDLEKPFYLFVNTSNQTAYGVLTQDRAGIKKPVGYCSKLLDPVSRGWPARLQALVATALLIEEVRKITCNAPLKGYTPHNVRRILQQKAEKWLTIIYAIINKHLEPVESGPLSPSRSAQACELYALHRAVELGKGKSGTIYTDSQYAYGVVHTFGKICEERGFVNTQGRNLIHQELIIPILRALREPKEIAVVHVKGRQKGLDYHTRGNNLADKEAQEAALRTQAAKINIVQEEERREGEEKKFTPEEQTKLEKTGARLEQGKWTLPDGREILPQA